MVEIAPNVEAEHVARLVPRPARSRCGDPIEAQFDKVGAGDERIDDADECVLRDVVVDASWQQANLISAIAVDEAHSPPPSAFNGLIL